MSHNIQVNDSSLPALFRAADSVSNKAQKEFLKLIIADLSFLVLGATLSTIPTSSDQKWIPILGVILLVLSFIVTIWIRQGESEKKWYGGRALAESVKTLAWRFVMKAEPFHITDREAEKLLQASLAKLLMEKKALAVDFDEKHNTGDQITSDMRFIRSLNIMERKTIYINQRIKDQREWYSKKSAFNSKREKIWFGSILVIQFTSFSWAAYLISSPASSNFIGVLSAFASACLMWLQLKKHRELSQSYSVAAQELGLIELDGIHITTDLELSKFIGDSENAISREHTMWIARRDEPITVS